MRGNIDDAFARRFQSLVGFRRPDTAQRLKLWQDVLSGGAPLADDVRLDVLAEQYALTGGAISNAVRHAAVAALRRSRDRLTQSDLLAGIAGALYVPQVGIINPGEFSPLNSIEIVIWVAIGGRNTLYGAVVGAILVNYGKSYFTGVLPEAWLFALGGLFVLVTLFLPRGIAGLLRRRSQEKKADSPDAAQEEAA